jgi:hypothetical protein
MLTPTIPDGSSLRLFYEGAIGVSGVGVSQAIDLTSLPKSVREDPTFTDNFLIFAEPGPGISNIDPDPAFTDGPDGLPAEMVMTLDSTDVANEISLQAWYIHSITR